MPVTPGRILSSRNTMYKSTYSFPKEVLLDRARSASRIPPAGMNFKLVPLYLGRASFYREILRDELVDLSKNAEYQALLAEHMRKRIETGRVSSREASARSACSGVALSTRSSDHVRSRGAPLSNRSRRL